MLSLPTVCVVLVRELVPFTVPFQTTMESDGVNVEFKNQNGNGYRYYIKNTTNRTLQVSVIFEMDFHDFPDEFVKNEISHLVPPGKTWIGWRFFTAFEPGKAFFNARRIISIKVKTPEKNDWSSLMRWLCYSPDDRPDRDTAGKTFRDYCIENRDMFKAWFSSMESALDMESAKIACQEVENSKDADYESVRRSFQFGLATTILPGAGKAPIVPKKREEVVIDGSNVPKMLVYPGNDPANIKKVDAARQAGLQLQQQLTQQQQQAQQVTATNLLNTALTQPTPLPLSGTTQTASLFQNPAVVQTLAALQDAAAKFKLNAENGTDYAINKLIGDIPVTALQTGVQSTVNALWDGTIGKDFSRAGLLGDWIRSRAETSVLDGLYEAKINLQTHSTDEISRLNERIFAAADPSNINFGLYTYMTKVQSTYFEFFRRASGLMGDE